MNKDKPIAVNQGNDNIFEDSGFNTEEAADLKIRADLMLNLRQYILEQGWTRAQAAAFFEETQPCISNLMNGEIGQFNVDKLLKMLGRTGLQGKVEDLSRTSE